LFYLGLDTLLVGGLIAQLCSDSVRQVDAGGRSGKPGESILYVRSVNVLSRGLIALTGPIKKRPRS
jgi:hypothetical protein